MNDFKLLSGKNVFNINHFDDIISLTIEFCETNFGTSLIGRECFYGSLFVIRNTPRDYRKGPFFTPERLRVLFQPHSGGNFIIHLQRDRDESNGEYTSGFYLNGVVLTDMIINPPQ